MSAGIHCGDGFYEALDVALGLALFAGIDNANSIDATTSVRPSVCIFNPEQADCTFYCPRIALR